VDTRLCESGNSQNGFHHVAAYAYTGGSEGERVVVDLRLRDGTSVNLATAKTFGNDSWEIARSVSEAIESLYSYKELPLIVDLWRSLPKASFSSDYIDIEDLPAIIESNDTQMNVYLNGDLIVEYDFSGEDNAEYKLEPIKLDWIKLLSQADLEQLNLLEGPTPS